MAGYDAALGRAKIEEVDFVEAVDRIITLDEWFPTAARIIAVSDECARDRRQRQRSASQAARVTGRLVCPYCHGARWVRFGGYSPLLTPQGGRENERINHCPRCTLNGEYQPGMEAKVIEEEGGVIDPNSDAGMPDMERTTWRVPRTEDGRVDMHALYVESRILRGLDPDGDDRPAGVAGFKTAGSALFAEARR